jgi:transposase-like protein
VLSIEDEAVVARVSPPPSAAAGRFLARAAADPPASEPLGLASLLTTPRHLAPARSRRRQARQEALQRYPIGYFHIDLAEVRTAEGKLNLFVAIDRTSKLARLRLEKRAGKTKAAQFLRDLLQALPYRIHTVLTDNGIQFTTRALDARAFAHIFDRVCRKNGIEHRLTKVRHP